MTSPDHTRRMVLRDALERIATGTAHSAETLRQIARAAVEADKQEEKRK